MSILALRFLTGVCLAGIYPVGMKIAAGWYREGLGRAIGFLVGALVLGTALPHLVRAVGGSYSWQTILIAISVIGALGGVLMALFVPDGPHHPKAARFEANAIAKIFSVPSFRASMFGYFGHMWELYTLWAFVPLILSTYVAIHSVEGINVSLWAFLVIAVGSIGCAGGGLLSLKLGSARIAGVQLAASGICCLLLPLFMQLPIWAFLGFLLFWGVVVVGDSPQFSTLNAQTAPPEYVGSGLTIANSIGFTLTVPSILLASELSRIIPVAWVFPTIVIGPILGLVALRPLLGSAK
jgi:predicted MFS family arabinose efflux permease